MEVYSTPVAEHEQARTPIVCPTWHSPLFFLVKGGIVVRCKSCRKQLHFISKTRLEQEWAALDKLSEVS